MRIAFLGVFLLLLAAALGGFLYLGLRPPHPATHTIDHTVSNDQLQTH